MWAAIVEYFEEAQHGFSTEEAGFNVDTLELSEHEIVVEVESEQKWMELLVDLGIYLGSVGLDE